MKNDFTFAANDNRDLSYRAGTRGRWQREHLQAFRDAQSGDRILSDGLALLRIFDEMEKSPTAKAALAWARQYGIEFIVDHNVERAAGYYQPGTGVVAIAKRHAANEDAERAIGIIVHEIRHAWQDYHGLIFSDDAAAFSTFAHDMAIEGLFEADADAHGLLARVEYSLYRTEERLVMLRGLQAKECTPERADLIEMYKKTATRERTACDNLITTLQEYMQDWYDPYGMGGGYAQARLKTYAGLTGQGAVRAPTNYEFAPLKNRLPAAPDFLHRRDQLEKLGDSFAGVNYLKGSAMRDRILRERLAPSATERGFDPDLAARPADSLTQNVRKAQIRDRLQSAPLPRRPLPK